MPEWGGGAAGAVILLVVVVTAVCAWKKESITEWIRRAFRVKATDEIKRTQGRAEGTVPQHMVGTLPLLKSTTIHTFYRLTIASSSLLEGTINIV